MRARVATALVAAALISVGGVADAAVRSDSPELLDAVAHVYSLGVGGVRCPSQAEWNAGPGMWSVWGATNMQDDVATLAPFVCDGALHVADARMPLWQQAMGVWVLVHESFHLRHWRFRRDEGKVSCQTMVHFTEAARKLGASPAQADELFPYALALYDRQGRIYPWYQDKTCVLPYWNPPLPPTSSGTALQP